MELGISLNDFGTYTFLSMLFSICVIFPPHEFNSAGFTIPKLFGSLLGDERFNFVEYHLKRSLLTIFIHASLPFLFCFLLHFQVDQPIFTIYPQNFIQYLSFVSALISLSSILILLLMEQHDWKNHYIVRNLQQYNQNWRELANEINDEFRVPIVYSIHYNAYSRVVVTSNWLLRVSNYNVVLARISDSRFFALYSHNHSILSDSNNGIQLIDIRVTSISGAFKPFFIRVHSQEMLDTLRDQIGRPIDVAESLTLLQPLHERFVEVFLKEVDQNPRYFFPDKEELEPCLGCSAVTSNIKLQKQCLDDIFPQASEQSCQQCFCRPMWCARCIGRVFASKQNQQFPDAWMAGKASCPTCRAIFCVIDVCFIE